MRSALAPARPVAWRQALHDREARAAWDAMKPRLRDRGDLSDVQAESALFALCLFWGRCAAIERFVRRVCCPSGCWPRPAVACAHLAAQWNLVPAERVAQVDAHGVDIELQRLITPGRRVSLLRRARRTTGRR